MKILIDAHFLDGKKHGVANFIERLYGAYRRLAPEDDLIFAVEKGADPGPEVLELPGVTVVEYKYGGYLRFLLDLPVLARRHSVDVVHTQYMLPLMFGRGVVRHVTIHDVLYEDYPELFGLGYRSMRTTLFRASAYFADVVSTVSVYSKQRIAAHYRLKSQAVHILPNGADVPTAGAEGAFDTGLPFRRYIAFVSRFERRKNHARLLEAFAEVRRTIGDIHLVLVGFDVDGTLARVRAEIEAAGLDEWVTILSGIPDERLTAIVRGAEAIVYPSLCEGFGMPIIESLLVNPNTLFSNTSAMSDFTFAGERMFDPTDTPGMAAKIIDCLTGELRLTDDWPRVRDYIRETYSWEKSAATLVALYHERPGSLRADEART